MSEMAQKAKSKISWINEAKGVAILLVLVHHFPAIASHFELRLNGAGPSQTLSRVTFIAEEFSSSLCDIVLLFIAAIGYQGVHLFFVISGYTLMKAEDLAPRGVGYLSFLRRRVYRLLPPYYCFILLLGAIGFVNSRVYRVPFLIGSSKSDLIVNLLLIRNFREDWIWIFPGSLWFVCTILQLYTVFPVIAVWLKARPNLTLLLILFVTLVYRFVAVYLMDAAPLGTNALHARVTPFAFGLARLFEFTFGAWLARCSVLERFIGKGERIGQTFVGLMCWSLGCLAGCYQIGYIFSDCLIGSGIFITVWAILELKHYPFRLFSILGERSYSIYFMHSLLIATPVALEPGDPVLIQFLIYLGCSVLLAFVWDIILGRLLYAWRLTRLGKHRTASTEV